MPAESCKLHAHIDPGNSDAAHLVLLFLNHPQQGVGRLVQVVEIEQVAFVFKVRVQPIMNFAGGEATAVKGGGKVCPVLHSHLIRLVLIPTTVHFGWVTKFQYSCSLLTSEFLPLGEVLNL